MRTAPWSGLARRGSEVGIRCLYHVDRLFGRAVFRSVLYVVVAYYLLFNADARRSSREYLARVGACGNGRKNASSVWTHFVTFGDLLLDRLLAWSGALEREVVITGVEQVIAAFEEGAGGVIITAHVGSFDVAQALGRRIEGLKLNILVHIDDDDQFNRVKASVNAQSQCEFYQVKNISLATGIHFAERLARGEFVLIAGDRVPLAAGAAVLSVPFLGHEAPFPAGPYQLAAVLKCPVFTFWCVREQQHYHAMFERLDDHDWRGHRNELIAALARTYAARLESVCLRYPYQWFNFYRFWQLPPDARYHVLNEPGG